MKKSKLETAKFLAEAHFKAEPNLKLVRLLEPLKEEDPSEPIKLLEVVEDTLERGVEPIEFNSDPTRGIGFNSTIVEVSPNEYKEILSGALKLISNWSLGVVLAQASK